MKAVTTRLDHLISRIKVDQKKRVKVDDPIVINIFTTGTNPEQSTTGLNGQFVHSLLLIDVLLRMKCGKKDRQELIALCKKEYQDNETELSILWEFEENYSRKNALRWYTRESFLYRILNKALRVQNIDLLFLLRFFISDIHGELRRIQCQSFAHVYRGQVLSTDELENLRKSRGQLISTNSFFSATTDRYQALQFLNNSDIFDDLHGVLFEIDADPRVVTTKPFADISTHSEFVHESEVLFMVGSIFRVESIRQNKDQFWIIRLTLCSDDEHDLKVLFGYMKKTYGCGDDQAGLLTFGQVLRRMGKCELAEKFYRRLLDELPCDHPSLSSLYYSLALALKDRRDLDSSLHYIHRSLEIELQSSRNVYGNVCNRYNIIGNIHRMQGHHDKALSWYNKGIKLLERENDVDGEKMAHFYNNMALVYQEQKNYENALDFNQITLAIRTKCLPSNHPDIGLSHNNIGNVYRFLGRYNLALKHLNQAIEIRLKSLPSNHILIAQSYTNIGAVYEDIDELDQALKFYQKAANIHRQSLPSQHPDRVRSEKDIERVRSKMK